MRPKNQLRIFGRHTTGKRPKPVKRALKTETLNSAPIDRALPDQLGALTFTDQDVAGFQEVGSGVAIVVWHPFHYGVVDAIIANIRHSQIGAKVSPVLGCSTPAKQNLANCVYGGPAPTIG